MSHIKNRKLSMEILIVGNGGIGSVKGKYSVNKHTANYFNDLIDLGLNVGYLQFEEVFSTKSGLQGYLLAESIPVHSVAMEMEKGIIWKILSYFKIVFLMIKTIMRYDFVYIFYPGHVPVLASIVSILLSKKYGLYIRGQRNLETNIGSLIIKKSEFCLTVSDLLKRQILKNNKSCETIAPMIDFTKKDILLDRKYSTNGITRCLFVGRVEVRKGIHDLMNAIKILNQKTDNLHFDIVGGGESFDDVKGEMINFQNVVLHGQVSEKENLLSMYRQADLFIFPSHDEGFPRVLYEAMMAKVPVITTIVGGIGGFMKDRHNCLAIDAQNPESIVKAVKEMLDSKKLQMQLVEQATEDVLKLFDGTRKKHSKLLMNKIESI